MILDFKEITKEDVAIAGGKGANLGEMTAAHMNVPRGFVITAEGYRDFLRENGLEEKMEKMLREAGKDEKKLLDAARFFRELINEGTFSEEVRAEIEGKCRSLGKNVRLAVRSSATAEDLPDASFAGQQETYLNVRGIEEVLERVKNCYASLWGERAVSYRLHQGYDPRSVSIAAVVQEMVESDTAGVLFTVHPVSNHEDEMLINASYGLGESVVSGRVNADTYIVDKSGKLLEVHIGSKETKIVYGAKETVEVPVMEKDRKRCALSNEEISELVRAGLEIERHYGMPMDIEWAFQDGELYILQARAVTTRVSDSEEALVRAYTSGIKIKRKMRETMAFQLEKMPFAYRVLDFDYIIAINQQKAEIFSEAGLVFNSNPRIDDDGIQTLPENGMGINKNIFHLFKVLREVRNLAHCASVCEKFMARYEADFAEIQQMDAEKMSLSDCKKFLAMSYEWIQRLTYDRFKYALFPMVLESKKMGRVARRVNRNYSSFDFFWGLNNKTAEVMREIAEMAEKIRAHEALKDAVTSGEDFQVLYEKFEDFKEMADAFLTHHGFKSDYNCYCLEAKTFWEDPDRLVHILRPILASKETPVEGAKDFNGLMTALKRLYGTSYRELEKNIGYFRYFHVVREESQYLWEGLFYYVRQCVTRANQLLLGDEDYRIGIANLFHRELMEAMERGSLNREDRDKIRRRNEKFPLAVKVWEASKSLVFEAKGDVLKGVSGSTGSAVGRVSVIHSPEEFYKMNKGDVLVCPFTDPEWTPLFKLASAVVADTGSALSHAAIVAREYNIPAVLGVGFATAKLKDGDRVQVDGDKGTVRGV